VAASTVLAAVAVGGVVLGLWLGDSSTPQSRPSEPFWLEATVTVEDWARTIGTPLPEDAHRTASRLTWLYQSNERYRYRVESASDAEGDRLSEVVADGSSLWVYDGASNAYHRGPLTPGPSEAVPYPAVSVLLGPAPAGGREALLAALNGRNQPEFYAAVKGEETMLGRRVSVIEFSPVSTSSGADGAERHEGTGRIWLDEDRMVILRYDIDSEAQMVSAVVTRFEQPFDHPGNAFRFVPPAGAAERVTSDAAGTGRVTTSGGSGAATAGGDGSGSIGVPAAPGFLSPSDLPDGFRGVAYEQNTEGDTLTSRTITYAAGAPGTNAPSIRLLEQIRAGGLPSSARAGERTIARGAEAFITTRVERITVTWWERGHLVRVTGEAVSEGDVRAFIEGLALVQ
jgi:outer membrane lipoprotein-sorting protein